MLDSRLGRWRKRQDRPQSPDDVVATWHQVERLTDGLPEQQVHGEPNGLAYLVAQFDLPVEID